MAIFGLFKDRQEAGQKLAMILEDFKGKNAVVLALPRGGVVVGAEIAKVLGLSLDIIVVRKIGSPESEEYAIGAIDVDGDGVWNEEELKRVNKEWLAQKIQKEKVEAQRRFNLYRRGKAPLDLKDKIAIIVDDGIATGLTIKSAIRYARKLGAQKVVVASPLAPQETVDDIKKEADSTGSPQAEIRVLETPAFFFAIGQFYETFPQVEDDEVTKILKNETFKH